MSLHDVPATLAEPGLAPSRLPRGLPMAEGRSGGSPAPRPPLRVLIVEDEGLLALEAETFLEQGGHTVVGIADTRTAALIRAGAARPDLALVDLRLLDGNSGLDLAADLGALGVPVLFVTSDCPERGGQGLALGCLHKPFDAAQLLRALAVVGRLLHGEPVDPATLSSSLHLFG